MIVCVQPGEVLRIKFRDEKGESLDGEFTIHFDTEKHPRSIVVQETAGLPGSVLGPAYAILYKEFFGMTPVDKKENEDEG